MVFFISAMFAETQRESMQGIFFFLGSFSLVIFSITEKDTFVLVTFGFGPGSTKLLVTVVVALKVTLITFIVVLILVFIVFVKVVAVAEKHVGGRSVLESGVLVEQARTIWFGAVECDFVAKGRCWLLLLLRVVLLLLLQLHVVLPNSGL